MPALNKKFGFKASLPVTKQRKEATTQEEY